MAVALDSTLAVVALPAAFSRWAIRGRGDEHWTTTAALSVFVGAAALVDHGLRTADRLHYFELTIWSHVFSYVVVQPLRNVVISLVAAAAAASAAAGTVSLAFGSGFHVELLQAVAGVAVSWVCARLSLHLGSQTWLMPGARAAGFLVGFVCAPAVALLLFPVRELYEAFIAAEPFLPPGVLRKASAELLVTTMQSQVSLGYVGVYVLRQSQARKNVLLTVDKSRAAGERTLCSTFVKHAVWFMAFVAIPYLLQRILVENVSDFTFARFSNMVETGLRIGSLFPTVADSNGPRTSLLSAVASSNLTVDAYAGEIGSIVRTGHSIVERVLFSMPKLALLPGILVSQPWLLLLVLPGNMGLDFVRAKAFAHLTSRMEKLNREIQELASRRSNMEQHDTESAEILQRVGASSFAEVQWRLRARHLQDKFLRLQALRLFRGFVDTLYIQDFVAPGIEIAIAYLLQFQQITAVDIWVYTRVVEDAQNTLLVRFRREAALATVKTNVERLQALSQRLKNRTRLRCKVDSEASAMQVKNLSYSRGSQLQVRLGNVSLEAGKAYAVTGCNGCGKSTLFGLLSACGKHQPELPAGIDQLDFENSFLAGVSLPSDEIAEIPQKLYCPLFTEPLAWMFGHHSLKAMRAEDLESLEAQVQHFFAELDFRPSASAADSPIELRAVKDDWYGKLSGGQRSKAELVRQIFLQQQCPQILLIDEALGPLDAQSKVLVQRKLKAWELYGLACCAGVMEGNPLEHRMCVHWGLDSLIEHGLLERVCEMLPALEIARATSACRNMQAFAKEVIPRLLAARCRPGLQLQTASASEAAVFRDWMRDTRQWNAGPNTSKPYNVAKEGCVPGDGGAWIFLEQGTDWLGFQGLYCNFASPRPKPKWVSFRLCLQTLEFSCGFFALSADRRTWGLQPLVFIFNYRGDDMQTGKRCFALQTQPVTGDLHVLQLEKDQIRAGVPYEVAVHLDWERGLLELFIDGTCVLRDIHFQVDLEPRYIGLYNWRSRAACGFS
ncbi:ssuB3, partial [Symbiodinium sp. CCMP2592]